MNPMGEMMVRMSKCAAEGVSTANFAVGSPSFEPPASFLEAFSSVAAKACRRGSGSFAYTPPAGLPELRASIAAEVVGPRQGGVAVAGDDVVVTAGAQSALVNVLRSVLSPGDAAVLVKPTYPYYKGTVEMWGGMCHYAECDPRSLDVDLASLSRAMWRGGRRLRALVLCSPCNPSGRVIRRPLLDDIARLVKTHCKTHGTRVWIVADHTYWNVTWSGVEVPPLFECHDDAVVVSSFSKDLGLAGERLGFVAVNPRSDEAGSLVATLAENNVLLGNLCPPSVIQHAMAEFLSVPGRFGAAVRKYRQNYKRCLDALRFVLLDAGFPDVPTPDGGFYLFPRLPTGIGEDAFLTALRERNVFALPGSDFIMPGRVRFCALLAPGSEGLEMARSAVGDALDELRNEGNDDGPPKENSRNIGALERLTSRKESSVTIKTTLDRLRNEVNEGDPPEGNCQNIGALKKLGQNGFIGFGSNL